MKLTKEYFSDPKNGKHFPSGQLKTQLDKICMSTFKDKLSTGKLFVIDNDLDSKLFLKFEKTVTDWEKIGTNIQFSTFHKAVKFHNVSDRTTYIIYRGK